MKSNVIDERKKLDEILEGLQQEHRAKYLIKQFKNGKLNLIKLQHNGLRIKIKPEHIEYQHYSLIEHDYIFISIDIDQYMTIKIKDIKDIYYKEGIAYINY
jgi:hypothetical protein